MRSPHALASLAASLLLAAPSQTGRTLPSRRSPSAPPLRLRDRGSDETQRATLAKAKARRAMRAAKRLKAKANGGCN